MSVRKEFRVVEMSVHNVVGYRGETAHLIRLCLITIIMSTRPACCNEDVQNITMFLSTAQQLYLYLTYKNI